MKTQKTIMGVLMVVVGLIALNNNFVKNYLSLPAADIWMPALFIVIAGSLPALLIIFGSLIIWGELEEKKAEKEIIKLERRLVSKKRTKKKR